MRVFDVSPGSLVRIRWPGGEVSSGRSTKVVWEDLVGGQRLRVRVVTDNGAVLTVEAKDLLPPEEVTDAHP